MSNYVYKSTYTVNGKPYEKDQLNGGCGLKRLGFDYAQGKGDYDGSPEYYFLRQGITNIYRNFYDRMNAVSEEL